MESSRPPSSTPKITRPATPSKKPDVKAETASTSHVAQPQDGVDAPSTAPRRASALPSGPTPPASPRNGRSTGAAASPRDQLPEGLKVVGSIPLRNVTSLDRLPEGLSVEDDIYGKKGPGIITAKKATRFVSLGKAYNLIQEYPPQKK
jgi:hypothetical protein